MSSMVRERRELSRLVALRLQLPLVRSLICCVALLFFFIELLVLHLASAHDPRLSFFSFLSLPLEHCISMEHLVPGLSLFFSFFAKSFLVLLLPTTTTMAPLRRAMLLLPRLSVHWLLILLARFLRSPRACYGRGERDTHTLLRLAGHGKSRIQMHPWDGATGFGNMCTYN